MTAGEIIIRVDRQKPNAFSQEEKLRWLAELEYLVKKNILDARQEGLPFREPGGEEALLTAPEPYGRMYERWLEAQMDLHNGEIERFNAAITQFNLEYVNFECWYARQFPGKNPGSWRF